MLCHVGCVELENRLLVPKGVLTENQEAQPDTRKDGRSREPLCRLVFICFSLLPNRSEDVAAPDAKKPVFGEPNVFTIIDFICLVGDPNVANVGREVQLPDER